MFFTHATRIEHAAQQKNLALYPTYRFRDYRELCINMVLEERKKKHCHNLGYAKRSRTCRLVENLALCSTYRFRKDGELSTSIVVRYL